MIKEEFALLSPHLILSIKKSEPTMCPVFEISDILLEKIRDNGYCREEFEYDPVSGENHTFFRGNLEFIKTDIEKITSTAFNCI